MNIDLFDQSIKCDSVFVEPETRFAWKDFEWKISGMSDIDNKNFKLILQGLKNFFMPELWREQNLRVCTLILQDFRIKI